MAVTLLANNVRGERVDLFHVAVVARLARRPRVSHGARAVFYPDDRPSAPVHVPHVHVRVDQTEIISTVRHILS